MSKRIKVLQMNKHYPPHIGGVEKVVKDIAEGLCQQRFRVRVLVCHDAPGPTTVSREGGVAVVRARSFGRVMSLPVSPQYLLLMWRLWRWCDIVHWHAPFPYGDLAVQWLPWAKRNTPLAVVTWHSDIVRQRFARPWVNRIQRLALSKTDVIVPTSPLLGEYSSMLSPFRDRQVPVPIGIDLHSLVDVDVDRETDWRRKTCLPPRFALFVGRLCYYKGLNVMIEAACKARVPLVVVGRGELYDYLVTEVARRGLEDIITIISKPVNDVELAFFYRSCDFLVFPSTYPSEAFGIVQVEAMAFGKPVINTRLRTGVPFVSIDGETGITVPPSDADALAAAMVLMWSDHGLRLRFGSKARARAFALFDKSEMIHAYETLYLRLFAKASQSPSLGAADTGGPAITCAAAGRIRAVGSHDVQHRPGG